MYIYNTCSHVSISMERMPSCSASYISLKWPWSKRRVSSRSVSWVDIQ